MIALVVLLFCCTLVYNIVVVVVAVIVVIAVGVIYADVMDSIEHLYIALEPVI